MIQYKNYYASVHFSAVDDVRLQPEFFSKNLHYNAAFAIVGGFKYYAPGFMQHG